MANKIKTAEEICKADKREAEIKKAYEAEYKAAQIEFKEATEEEFKKYEKIWHPAKERWEAFAAPYFKKLQARQVANEKAIEEAIAEVRRGWQECPICGIPAARYQSHCTDEKCNASLLLGKKKDEKTSQTKD